MKERGIISFSGIRERCWQRYKKFYSNLEVPRGQIRFFDIDSTEADWPDGEPITLNFWDIGVLYFCDEKTGKPLIGYLATENWYVADDLWEWQIIEFEYEPFPGYCHPLSGEKIIEAEVVCIKTWDANERWEKISKAECSRSVVVFEEEWSQTLNRPRRSSFTLEQSIFEPISEGEPTWWESLRMVRDGSLSFFYLRDDSGDMCLAQFDSPRGEPHDRIEIDIPENIGSALLVTF